MIIRIPIPWAKPTVPGLDFIEPTRDQPLVIDNLQVFPENILISGTPCSYDSIRNIFWSREYTQVTGLSLGSDESILFSFESSEGLSFNNHYSPAFFTEARRKVPNTMWSAYAYIAEKSFYSRVRYYKDQADKYRRWTIGGTTFDLSFKIIKDGKCVQFWKSKIYRKYGVVVFEEKVPHNGIFRKSKTILIEANSLNDQDCFFALLKYYYRFSFD